MRSSAFAIRLMQQEVAGLLQRMALVRPFALAETMVPAATPTRDTLRHIDRYLASARQRWTAHTQLFHQWLGSHAAQRTPSAQLYRRYVFLRLQANSALAQFDLFSDAITQRSEATTGVWLAGLDCLAQDALALERPWFRAPPVLCYLDRGIGAAIRRAHTRLPGGGDNPVALIRVPRERMVGLGIASSLVHEAGHQGAALLDLVAVLRNAMEPALLDRNAAENRNPWVYWHRWISEIVADLWSVARLGIAATLGVMNVVSLPRVFVFRTNLDDPHPTPWVRVLLSAHLGQQLYPHPQWQQLMTLWKTLYPLQGLDTATAQSLELLQAHAPVFSRWLLSQAVPMAQGEPLGQVLADPELHPARLEEHVERWARHAPYPHQLRPCQAFAVLGYSRLNRGTAPCPEVPFLSALLTEWALNA